MYTVTLLILAGLAYGAVRFLRDIIRELADFAVEAWHTGESEH